PAPSARAPSPILVATLRRERRKGLKDTGIETVGSDTCITAARGLLQELIEPELECRSGIAPGRAQRSSGDGARLPVRADECRIHAPHDIARVDRDERAAAVGRVEAARKPA